MFKKYKMIVGLGNPGEKYKDTYHNIGFFALDIFKEKLGENSYAGDKNWREHKKSNAFVVEFPSVTLVKPLEFMNLSGKAIKKIASYSNISPEDILIIHDDIDLNVGDIRIEFDRGAAGHNGVKSIINELGTKKFWRMRVGIRSSQKDDTKAEEKVLRKMKKEEQENIYQSLTGVIEKVIENT